MSHTSGPWAVSYADKNGQQVVGASNYEICTCWHHSVGAIKKEMEANARLIAAAPELLAELKAMVERFSGYQGMELLTAKEVIAKAEGRDSTPEENKQRDPPCVHPGGCDYTEECRDAGSCLDRAAEPKEKR